MNQNKASNRQKVNKSEERDSSSNEVEADDQWERELRACRGRAKNMNPLRRARQTWTSTDGANNPNIQGVDNGANAWFDVQLNEVDSEIRYWARYAKHNSDMGRCFDIDDVPIRGPPNTEVSPGGRE